MAYKGPKFPITRQMKNGSVLHLLEVVHRYANGEVRNEFIQKVAAIRARERDGFLGPKGTAEALRELRAEFETKITTGPHLSAADSWNDFINGAKKRVTELQTKLTARKELPSDVAPHLLMRHELQQDRIIREAWKLDPSARRAKIMDATQKMHAGDPVAHDFLSDVFAEPGLLDPQTAALVEQELMRVADPVAYNELSELLGPMVNGQRDPMGGALPVVEYTLDLFRQYMDAETGTDPVVESARARFAKQIETKGAPVVLTETEARNAQVYQTAKAFAAEHGRVVSIESGEPASGNGAS